MLVERPARLPLRMRCGGASRWGWRISSVLDRAEHLRRTLGVGICGERPSSLTRFSVGLSLATSRSSSRPSLISSSTCAGARPRRGRRECSSPRWRRLKSLERPLSSALRGRWHYRL